MPELTPAFLLINTYAGVRAQAHTHTSLARAALITPANSATVLQLVTKSLTIATRFRIMDLVRVKVPAMFVS